MRISDWSSDVCSSDLCGVGQTTPGIAFNAATTWSRLAWNSARLASGTSCGPDSAATAAAVTISGMLVMWLEFMMVTAFATTSGPTLKPARQPGIDRKSVVQGKSVSGRVDLGGRRVIKTTN